MTEFVPVGDLHVVLQTGPQTVDWVIVAATVVIAVSALASLWLNWRLTQDNRALRKAGTEPVVVAYLEIKRLSAAYLIYLALENVGQGPALDVEYFVDADPQDFAAHGVLKVPVRTQRKVASLLPQGGRIERFMGGSTTLLGDSEEAGLQPFRVRVSYTNLRGVAAESKEYPQDISEVREVVEVVPSDERIAKALEKIEKHLSRDAADEAGEEVS